MREILFRGKRVHEKNKWVYGSLTISEDCMSIWSDNIKDDVEVNPETVSQFTGLYDKNGAKIFEGDIITAFFRTNHSKQKFRVTFGDAMFLFDNSYVKVPKYDIYGLEVIGNIYDNPELLE